MNNEEQHRGKSTDGSYPVLLHHGRRWDGLFFFFSLIFGLLGRGERMLVFQPFLFVVITTTTPFFPFPPVLVVGIFLNVVNEATTCAWVTKDII